MFSKIIEEFYKQNKLVVREPVSISCMRIPLKDGDRRYLEMAVYHDCKLLITEDSDFLQIRDKIKQIFGVNVKTIGEILNEL